MSLPEEISKKRKCTTTLSIKQKQETSVYRQKNKNRRIPTFAVNFSKIFEVKVGARSIGTIILPLYFTENFEVPFSVNYSGLTVLYFRELFYKKL